MMPYNVRTRSLLLGHWTWLKPKGTMAGTGGPIVLCNDPWDTYIWKSSTFQKNERGLSTARSLSDLCSLRAQPSIRIATTHHRTKCLQGCHPAITIHSYNTTQKSKRTRRSVFERTFLVFGGVLSGAHDNPRFACLWVNDEVALFAAGSTMKAPPADIAHRPRVRFVIATHLCRNLQQTVKQRRPKIRKKKAITHKT